MTWLKRWFTDRSLKTRYSKPISETGLLVKIRPITGEPVRYLVGMMEARISTRLSGARQLISSTVFLWVQLVTDSFCPAPRLLKLVAGKLTLPMRYWRTVSARAADSC